MSARVAGVLAASLFVCGLAGVTSTASAATPSCGNSCTNLFSRLYGSSFVPDVLNEQAAVGTPIVLAPASNSEPGEDFTASFQGTVNDFIAAGLMSSGLSSGYGTLGGYEFEYAPFGVDSGLCMGVGVTPTNQTPVVLEACGVSVKTVWIEDPALSFGSYGALINGATDTSFSNPYALTDLKPGGQRQLFTWPLRAGGIIQNRFANQLWGEVIGVVHAN